MTTPPPRRPWWKRKLVWAAVLALWLAAAYLAASGPIVYGKARGWVSDAAYRGYLIPAYEPVAWLLNGGRPGSVAPPTRCYRAWLDYNRWCTDLGTRHAASD